MRTVSLSSNSWAGRLRFVGASMPSAFTCRIDSTSRRLSGVGLEADPTKPVTPGDERMANHTSSDGVHRTSRYPGNTFLDTVTFLPFLNSTTSSIGTTISWIRSPSSRALMMFSRLPFTLFS